MKLGYCHLPSFLGLQASVESWEGTLDWEVVAEHWSLQEEVERGAAQHIPQAPLLAAELLRGHWFWCWAPERGILLRTSDGHK